MKLIFILLISCMILPAFAEDYYYFQEQKLSAVPEFCIIEFEDPQLPGAPDMLYQITQNAIQEWEDKLVRHTGEKDGWDFTTKIISQERYDDLFSQDTCDVTIYFEREPTTQEERITAGHTYAMWGSADITIFYLEPVWVYTGQTSSINGDIYEIADISHFKNSLDPYNNETIKHEIGHALGLDHYPATTEEITKQNGIYLAPSIMTLSEDDFMIDRMEITDYDIRSLVNLYGEDGINEPDLWWVWDVVFYGLIILVTVLIVKRKFSKKQSRLLRVRSSESKCIRCNKDLQDNSNSICSECLQKDGFGI